MWSLITAGTNIILVYLPTKDEDVSLNKVDLLLKSYLIIQIKFQSLIKIGWGYCIPQDVW